MLNYGNKYKNSLKHANQVQVAGNLVVLEWLEDRWVFRFSVVYARMYISSFLSCTFVSPTSKMETLTRNNWDPFGQGRLRKKFYATK